MRILVAFIALNLGFLPLNGQSVNDTANYPYWIGMMQDRSVNFYQTQRAFNLYWQNRTIEKGSGWKVFKRWEWYAEKIVDSLGNFPVYEMQYQDMMDKIIEDDRYWDKVVPGLGPGSAACKTQGDWKSIGPNVIPTNNTGQINGMGRVNSIALHPADTNTFFVGAAAGGIWKTTNGGLTWSVNTDSLPTLGVSAIAIDPNNPAVMYFGSGDRDAGDAVGYGVFKSTNGGATWTISNSGMGNRTVGRLIIDPNNTSVLLAACNGGIYRSTNSGASWTQTFSGGFFKDIVFKPDNSNVAYATKDGLIYRSVNNGQSWSALTSGIPTTGITRAVLAVSSQNPSLLYVWMANGSVHKGFYLSRDSGTNFRTQSTTPNLHDYSTNGSGSSGQAWYNMDMVVDPGNEAIVYCGGVNVFRSDDTGRTWTIAGYWVNQIHADQHELVASPITNRVFAGNDGGLYATRNYGNSWTPLKSGLGIAQIYKLDAAQLSKDKLITGFQDNGTANYNEGWYTTRGGDGMDCAIDQTDPQYSYGELYYGNIFRVYNVNMQATIATNGYIAAGSDTINESGGWVTPFVLKEGSGNTMYIGYKNIWRSNNIKAGTVQWKKISNNLGGTNSSNFTELESSVANPDILYASRSNGTFFRSDDVNAATPTWNTLTQPISGVVNAIETDPKNQNVVYIAIGLRVYRSTNKGSTWTQVASTFSNNVATILLDTSNIRKGIYVGTYGGGVWYTDTTLSAWRYFSKGLPNTVSVTDLKMYYEPTKECKCNVLYGGTYNRGTWHTSIYHDGTQKPVALLDKYDTAFCKSSVLNLKDKSCFNPTRFKWEFGSGANYVNGSDSSSQNPSLSFNTPGKYNFKFMAENCIGIDTLNGYVLVGDTVKSACTPSTTNSVSGLGIFYVELSTMTRTSSGRNPEGAYIDLSCSKVVRLKKGKKYALKVTTGSTYSEQVKAFIDFNNNGTLNDGGELVYQPSAAVGSHIDTITIPMGAVTDKVLRLRIRSDYLSIGTNPCSNLSYGQTEDYGIYIESESLKPRFVNAPDSMCQGNKVVFTDSTSGVGASYSWNFGSGAVPSTASGKGPHSVKYNTSGYKKVTLTVDGISYAKDSAVKVLPAPNINIVMTKGDSSLCRLKPFTLSVQDAFGSGATYQWRLNSINLVDSVYPNLRIGQASFSDSGVYSIIASTGSCKDTAYQYIRVRPLPVSGFSVNDSTQCHAGNSFTFTNASSISSGTYSNKWFFGDNGTDNAFASVSHSYNMYGTYQVKLVSTSNYGCLDSMIRTVYVHENAVPNFTINNTPQCFNTNSFTFTNTSTLNSGTYSGNWTLGDGTSTVSNTTVSKHYNAYSSSYTVKLVLVTNNNCMDSITRNISMNPSPAAGFNVNDTDQCLAGNGFAFINTGSISSGTYTSTWNFGDLASSNLLSPTHSYLSSGTYSVRQILTSDLGCRDTLGKTIYVHVMPKADFIINDSTQCFKGNSVDLIANGKISSGSTTPFWRLGNGAYSSASSLNVKYTKDSVYLVILTLTSDKGCKDSVQKPIHIYPQTETKFSIDNSTQCYRGNQYLFTNLSKLKSGTYASQWDFGDGTSSNSSASALKTYSNYTDSVQVTLKLNTNYGCKDTARQWVWMLSSPKAEFTVNDSDQCLNSNVFAFANQSSANNGSYASFWKFGDNSTSHLDNPSHTYLNFGQYRVKLITTSSGVCKDSIEHSIIIYPNPKAGLTLNDTAQCFKGNKFDYSDNSSLAQGTYTSFIDFGDNDTSHTLPVSHSYADKGTYQVRMVCASSQNCQDTLEQTIQVHETPSLSLNITDSIQCQRTNAFVCAGDAISLPHTSGWKADGVDLGITSKTITHNFADTGWHTLTYRALNALNCQDELTKMVYVAPHPSFTLLGDLSICLGGTLALSAQSSTVNTYYWIWNSDNQLTGNTFSKFADQAGKNTLRAIADNTYSCKDTQNVLVDFNALPLPVIVLMDDLSANGMTLEVKAVDSTGIPVLSRLWSASTGESGQDKELIISSMDSFTLRVVLSITDTNGCIGSTETSKFYLVPNKYFLPNTISPNGDGINDEFAMSGFVKFRTFHMKILSRWGGTLFESDDPNVGWDGYYMDEPVPDGSYVYFIEFEDLAGNKQVKKGFVIVLR